MNGLTFQTRLFAIKQKWRPRGKCGVIKAQNEMVVLTKQLWSNT